MNCPTCNANLQDSAAYCFSCGSVVRSGSFSYLPSGTPSWPTSDADAAYGEAGGVQTLSAIQVADQEASAARDVSKPRRSTRSALGIVAVLAISVLLGAGISLGTLWTNGFFTSAPHTRVHVPPVGAAGATPAATPGSSTAFTALNSTNLGISMKYPSTWVKTGPQQISTDMIFVLFVPQRPTGTEFLLQRISGNTSAKFASTNDANQLNLSQFTTVQHVHNLQPTTVSQPSIGGLQWDEQDATFNDDNSVSYHYVTIAVQHSNVYYNISFFAPNTLYAQAVQQDIQPMLDSLAFL